MQHDTPLPYTPRGGTYLVCVDAREECRVALRLACMKARARSGAVMMIHVIPPADFQTLGTVAERMREERLLEGKTLLNLLAAEATQTYGITPLFALLEGSAGDEIINAATKEPTAIMLVLGIAVQNSGRGKLSGWIASQLGGKLLVPLLMVPGNLTDQQLSTLI